MDEVHVITAWDIPDAWRQLVRRVVKDGVWQDIEAPYNTRCLTLYNVLVHVVKPATRPMGSEAAGVNDAAILAYALEFFLSPVKAEGYDHSYGDRLRDQWEPIAGMLAKSPGTRRAVALVAREGDLGGEYPPCVRELNFFMKAPGYGEVHTTVFMRSWDAFSAGNPDMGSFQLAAEHVAGMVGKPTGALTVLATNAHVYEAMMGTIKDMLGGQTKAAAVKPPSRSAGTCKACGGQLIWVSGHRVTGKMCLRCDAGKPGVERYLASRIARAYRKGRRFEYRVKRVFEEMGATVFRCAGSKPLDLVVIWPGGHTDFVECKSYPNPWHSDYDKVAGIAKEIRREVLFVHPTGARRDLIIEVVGPYGLVGLWGNQHGKAKRTA